MPDDTVSQVPCARCHFKVGVVEVTASIGPLARGVGIVQKVKVCRSCQDLLRKPVEPKAWSTKW